MTLPGSTDRPQGLRALIVARLVVDAGLSRDQALQLTSDPRRFEALSSTHTTSDNRTFLALARVLAEAYA